MSALPPDLSAAVRVAVEDGLEELLEIVRIPSHASDEAAKHACAARLTDILRADGWQAQVEQAGRNPVVLGSIDLGQEPRETLLLYGHYDVQPAEPLSAWHSPPFEPQVRDGRIYARGIADNKGQFYCHLMAVRALRSCGLRPPLRLKIVLDGEEEMGSPSMPLLVERRRSELGASLMVTADGPVHPSGRPLVCFGVRGVLKLRLTVRTSAEDRHSGNFGNIAPNAALRLAHILSALKGEDGRVRVPGFYDDVRPPGERDRAALAAIPFDESEVARMLGAAALDGPVDVRPAERLMFLPTFNVTGFSSGYSGPDFKTVIPCEAHAQIDIRLVVDQDPDRIFALLQAFLKAHYPEADLTRLGHYHPSRTSMDTPYAAIAVAAVREGFRQEPVVYPSLGASSPDAVFAGRLGIPSILIPYGNADEANHAPNENLRLDHLEAGVRTSAALFLALGKEGGPS